MLFLIMPASLLKRRKSLFNHRHKSQEFRYP